MLLARSLQMEMAAKLCEPNISAVRVWRAADKSMMSIALLRGMPLSANGRVGDIVRYL